MKRRIELLPHWCQVFGYSYLAVFLIGALCTVFCSSAVFSNVPIIYKSFSAIHSFASNNWSYFGMMNFLALFMAILSKEKVEDEMTRSIRINALIYFVLFAFLINFMLYLPRQWMFTQIVRNINDLIFDDFGIMLLIYAILYKAMILTGKLRSAYEE